MIDSNEYEQNEKPSAKEPKRPEFKFFTSASKRGSVWHVVRSRETQVSDTALCGEQTPRNRMPVDLMGEWGGRCEACVSRKVLIEAQTAKARQRCRRA